MVAVNDGDIQFDKNGRPLYIEYKTGIAIQPPKGHHTELFPRSSISKYNLLLCNSIGLIDEGYTGEIILRFKIIGDLSDLSKLTTKNFNFYKKGDKIGQIVIRKTIHKQWVLKESLLQTEPSFHWISLHEFWQR